MISQTGSLPPPAQLPPAGASLAPAPLAPPPGGGATASAIEANLVPPPLTSPVPPLDQAQAQAAQMAALSRQWAAGIGNLASTFGINLGGSLVFAEQGAAHIDAALARGAPAEQLDQLTKRLKGNWMVRGPEVFERLRHGLFRNAEQNLRQSAVDLARAGVTGEPLQAFREAAATLRQLEASGAPANMGVAELQAAISQMMAKLTQTALAHMAEHPEHGPALQQAMMTTQQGMGWMTQGLYVTESMKMAIHQALSGLPGQLPPGGPAPLPPGMPPPGAPPVPPSAPVDPGALQGAA